MSEQKRYTAQEMRERADDVDQVSVDDYGRFFYEKEDAFNPDTVRDMLRYAADIKEENEKLKTRIGEWEYSYGIKSKEAFELKARLEAVVKTADGLCDCFEFSMSWINPKANIQRVNERIAAYRAARGEPETENK